MIAVRAKVAAAVLGVGAVAMPTASTDDPLHVSAALALSVGLDHDAAVTATAISAPESGCCGWDEAVGDTTITDETWGPSFGRWQIRCLWDSPVGATRDCSGTLHDPQANARAMLEISGGGANWRPWSAYLNGAYEDHLQAAEAAVSDVERGMGVVVPHGLGKPVLTAKAAPRERSARHAAKALERGIVGRWVELGGWSERVPPLHRAWQAIDDGLFG